MKLPSSLRGREGVVIDTNIFIYLFEDNKRFGPLTEFIVQQAERDLFDAVITPITVAEILVKPLQLNRPDLADRCRSAMRRFKNIRPVVLSFHAGEMAGALKAKYNLPLPDMMQVAVALQSNRPAIITNDKILKKIKEVEIYLLNDFIKNK